MPLGLLKYGLRRKYRGQRYFPAARELRPAYDVVIIGGGGHGLACAYYLARDWGISNVAVLEKGWLASGNTARNTAIIRSNYLTPEGALFYEESMRLYLPPFAHPGGAPRSTSISASILNWWALMR